MAKRVEAKVKAGARIARLARARRKSAAAANEELHVDVGPLTNYLGYYLRRLYEGYRRHFVDVASDLELGPREVGAAFVIGLNPGLTPSQLSGALAMDGAQVTALLKMFELRGFLERRVSGTDGRSHHVFLTKAGHKLLDKLGEVVGWFDRSFTGDALTDAELQQLIALLAKLLNGTNR